MSCGCGAGCAAGACAASGAAAAAVLMSSHEETPLSKEAKAKFKAKLEQVKLEAQEYSAKHLDYMGYSLGAHASYGDGEYEGDDWVELRITGDKPGESYRPNHLSENAVKEDIRKFEAKGKWGKRLARILQ